MYSLELRYDVDVFLVRLRKWVKRVVPTRLVSKFGRAQGMGPGNVFDLLTGADPWMSPNIWNEIVSHYSRLEAPVVIEFGIGASSLHHVNIMRGLRDATYVGVEDNPDWFWLVAAAIFRKIKNNGSKYHVIFTQPEDAADNVDIELRWGNLSILLRLRTTLEGYVSAFDRACDVVVVDGISRKECIRKILATDYLREGGMLMLMEAGRGSEDWWEGKLYGEDDYSPEVAALISLGGVFITGNGVDNWSGSKRKSPRPTSYYCPMEACKLILPEWKNATTLSEKALEG